MVYTWAINICFEPSGSCKTYEGESEYEELIAKYTPSPIKPPGQYLCLNPIIKNNVPIKAGTIQQQ